jgi:hypothetical protein
MVVLVVCGRLGTDRPPLPGPQITTLTQPNPQPDPNPPKRQLKFPPQTYGGEALFIPRAASRGEDDGYLVTLDYSYTTNQSSLVVYDARTMDPTPVCRVLLPRRVPWGFHALWVPRAELAAQLPKGFVPPPLPLGGAEEMGGSSDAGRGGEL